VVPAGVGYGMGRVAQAMTEDQGFELLFDLPEARQWLQVGNSPKDNAKSS
jgi:hypothetical protein